LLIGQRLWEGKQLYLDLWDNKPPGIFFLYAVMVEDPWQRNVASGLVGYPLASDHFCLIFKFAERPSGNRPGSHCGDRARDVAGLVGILGCGAAREFPGSFRHRSLLSVEYEGKPRWLYDFQSGILFGVAFWFKYNAVTFGPTAAWFSRISISARSPSAHGSRRFTLSGREWMKRVGIWITASACVYGRRPGVFGLVWRMAGDEGNSV